MQYPKNRKLFTVKEVSQVCGISRTTLIRMEESGFLKPYRIDPDSGYRYYDADNITSIGQYLFLQELGLSRSELADLYYMRMDIPAFLAEQKARLYRMTCLVSQLEMRMNHNLDKTASITDIPGGVFYCFKIGDKSINDVEELAYDTYGKCIKEGIHLKVSEPLNAFLDIDWSQPVRPEQLYDMEIAFPVSDPVESNPNLKELPESHVFSFLSFGGYYTMESFIARFQGEIKSRNLVTTGPTRIISLIAPYTGSHFKQEDYCTQIAVPVEQ